MCLVCKICCFKKCAIKASEMRVFEGNSMKVCFSVSWQLYKRFLSWGQPVSYLRRGDTPRPAVISRDHSGGAGGWSWDQGWKHQLVLSTEQSHRIDVIFYSVPRFETSCKTFNGLKSLALIKYHLTQINRIDKWSQRNSLFTWLLIDSEVEKHEQGTSRGRGQLR